MEKININLCDIIEYVSTSGPIKEGETVLKAGHVIVCGFEEGSPVHTIIGSCLQTSNLNEDPHIIEITIKPKVQDWKAKCTCKDGLKGKCKHIVAVLLHANRAEKLEKLSCTDLQQVYEKVNSKTNFSNQFNETLKIENFCHPTTKKGKLTPVGDVEQVLRENFEIMKKQTQRKKCSTKGLCCDINEIENVDVKNMWKKLENIKSLILFVTNYLHT